MKKILYIALFVIGISLVPNTAKAQNSYVSFGYRMAVPVLSFSDYIKATSFRGVQFDYKYFFNDNLAFGFQFSWNGYYENKPRQTHYLEGGGAITAEQFNFSYSNNLLIGADYYFTTGSIFKPFLGVRLGTGYLEIDKFLGAIQFQDTQWRFSYNVTGGALFQIPNSSIAFSVEASWNQLTYDNIHYNGLSNVGIFVGIAYSGQFNDL